MARGAGTASIPLLFVDLSPAGDRPLPDAPGADHVQGRALVPPVEAAPDRLAGDGDDPFGVDLLAECRHEALAARLEAGWIEHAEQAPEGAMARNTAIQPRDRQNPQKIVPLRIAAAGMRQSRETGAKPIHRLHVRFPWVRFPWVRFPWL